MIEVTVVSSKSPQLVAMPMPWVRCMHGSPRRSSPWSAMSSWMSAALWKCSMAAAGASASVKVPPTAWQASMQIKGL